MRRSENNSEFSDEVEKLETRAQLRNLSAPKLRRLGTLGLDEARSWFVSTAWCKSTGPSCS